MARCETDRDFMPCFELLCSLFEGPVSFSHIFGSKAGAQGYGKRFTICFLPYNLSKYSL